MGKGSNVAKASKARADKLRREKKKGAGGGGSGGVEKRKAQQGHQCKACLQTFMVTLTRAELEQHWESKHSKLSLAQCFPDL